MVSESPSELSPQQQLALLAQYRECSAHHILGYQLMWQLPAVTVTISGLLVAAAFGYDVPDAARLAAAAMGTLFVFTMTVAAERDRLMQMRRRKDMQDIERRLASIGVEPIAWEFSLVVQEVQTGAFPSTGGLRLYRFQFFPLLRALMYTLIALMLTLSALALADTLGAEIF